MRVCAFTYWPNQLICRRDSSCTWWQAVTGLIIRRLDLNPTYYIIHITHYQETEERSHAHGKEKDQCSIMSPVFGVGSVKFKKATGTKPYYVFLIEMFSVCIPQAALVVAMVLL